MIDASVSDALADVWFDDVVLVLVDESDGGGGGGGDWADDAVWLAVDEFVVLEELVALVEDVSLEEAVLEVNGDCA